MTHHRSSSLLRASLALLPCLSLAACADAELDSEGFTLDDGELDGSVEHPSASGALLAEPGVREASPGFSLTITKSGADIQLDWMDLGPGYGYGVLSCPRPYFDENDPDVILETPKIAGTSATLAGANDGITRYYRILSNEGDLSSTVGKMTIPLEAGFSELPVCLEGSIGDSNALMNDTGSATVLGTYTWDSAAQDWRFEAPGSATPIPLSLGTVVALEHPGAALPTPSTYTWVGSVPATHELSVAMVAGDNKVTTPLNLAPGLLASDLLPMVPGGLRIGTWDNLARDYHWYPTDGDFAVPACAPIRIETNAPSVFPDCDPASVEWGNSVYYNWYTGGSRDAEQGTHGIGLGDCPAGHVVVGLKAYEGGGADWIDGIGMHCRELSIEQGALSFGAHHYSNWYTGGARDAEQGSHGGDPGTGECPAGSVVAGVQYFEGGHSDWVDGIGVLCRELEWNGAGFTYESGTADNWYFGGTRGAEQGTHGVGMGECASGQFVTGVQYFEGGHSDWVDGVGVRCRELDFHNVCF